MESWPSSWLTPSSVSETSFVGTHDLLIESVVGQGIDNGPRVNQRLAVAAVQRLFRGPVIVGSRFAIYKASAHRPHEFGLATVLLQPPAPISGPRMVPSEELEKYLRCPATPEVGWPARPGRPRRP
jgi:hypothetical protein